MLLYTSITSAYELFMVHLKKINDKIRLFVTVTLFCCILFNVQFNDKGKLVERQGRKTTDLRHYAMIAGLPKEGNAFIIRRPPLGVFCLFIKTFLR